MDNVKQAEMPNVKKPIYKRWWVWVLGILLLFYMVRAGDALQQQSESNQSENQQEKASVVEKPKEDAQPAPPEVIRVDAKKLFADYEANEVAADQQYKGKKIEVAGTIKDIGKDILDTPYVSLESGNVVFTVQCMFDKSELDTLAQLKKSQTITVSGKVSGKLGNVIIKDCQIVQ